MNSPQASVKVPEPRQARRRASAASRVFLWLFVLFLFGAITAGAAGFYAYQEYTLPGPLAEKKIFTIDNGLGTPDIAAALEEGGIISDARVFSAMAYFTGTRTRLKAGEYEFAQDASMRDVMALIASGKSITYKVLIPEGWTSQMAVARVNANDILAGPPAAAPPEGAIMPDTYVFRRGMTKQKLVEDMQAAQTALLDALWEKRLPVASIKTKEDAVILASIVEKETGVAEERPVIASVFVNRLKNGMRLQSDPTIIYGIAGGKGKLDRPLTRNDIETATPYNTYRINGLPPGPIANPGRAAIEAVLTPPPTEYLYFVADGTGGHAFAATLEEHNRNVKKWREIAGNATAAAAAETETAEQTAGTATTSAEPAPAAAKEGQTLPDIQADPPPPAVPPPAVAETPAEPQPAVPEQPAAPEPAPPAVPPAVKEAPATVAPEKAAETAAPKPAEPEVVKTPEPVKKPEKVATPETAPALKPGSVIKVDGKLVAIPKRKPRR